MASAKGWTLRGGVSRRTRGFPYVYQVDDGWQLGQQRGIFNNSFISLAHERNIGDWNLYAAVSSKRSEYADINPYQTEDGAARNFSNASLGRWRNVDLRLSTHRWRDHDLMAGIEYQFDRQQQIVAGTVGEEPLAQFFGDNRRRGLFVQDAWRLNETHRLILGLRRDHARIGGRNTNPRLAWIWSGVPDATLKLMYGSAFREANLFEFQANHPFGVPTPAPERVRTLELAWEHTLNHQLQYRLSVYGSQLRDLINLSPETAVFENSAPIRNVGAELGVERRWAGGQQLRAALSLQDTKDEQGRRLSNSPRTLVKLMFKQPLHGDALQLSWQALSVSRRATSDGALPGYALLNATLLWRPSLGTDVSVGVYNMGDVRYYDQSGPYGSPLAQERRSLRFSLTRRFGS
ncbi:TonB-dependent receptor plug domain-containing protein [Rugamonas sp. CCM 8940]